MNKMIVNPWLSVSPLGPVTCCHPVGHDLIHLRQGEMDGACGPYCITMALITLGVLTRDQARNLDQFDGRTREGRFRENLLAFGSLVTEGTDDFDISWLAETFKGVGVTTQILDVARRRKATIEKIAEAVDRSDIPIVGVEWQEGSGHWLMVVGYQGYQFDEAQDMQITHLLCLDPTSDAPRTSLWNAVIEVFDESGESVNEGRFYCRHWGTGDIVSDCRISTSVVVGINE